MNLQTPKRNSQMAVPQILSATPKKLTLSTCFVVALAFFTFVGAKPTYATDSVCPPTANVGPRPNIGCTSWDTYSYYVFQSTFDSAYRCTYTGPGTKPCHAIVGPKVLLGQRLTSYGTQLKPAFCGYTNDGTPIMAPTPDIEQVETTTCQTGSGGNNV